jgi:ADP-heptose:LPS heptosyltransferase
MWATVGCAEVLRYLGNGFIGALRLALWPRHRPLRVERICVYRIGAIGDLVCATPALFAIRRAYPEARLTLLTTPGNYSRARHAEELLGGAGWIDEVISYDLDQVRTMKDRVAFGRKLRARKFEVWFDLTLDRARLTRMLRDMVLARLLGARWAFGWRLEHLGFAARAEAEMREFPDEVERLAAVLRSSGIDDDATSFPSLASEPAEAMRSLLDEAARERRPIVVIAPGARRPCNLWPTDRFAAVCAYLTSKGVSVFLLGSAAEYSLCEEIRCGSRVVTNLAGKLSLPGSYSLLRRSDLLICVDSGPQHLASAAGTRCIAIFSQRNPRRRWYPHGNQHRVLEGSVECHTCLLDVCPFDNRCINQITVEQVLAAVTASLDASEQGRAEQASCSPQVASE